MTPADRLRQLADAATPGPWEALHDNGTVWAHGHCIAYDGFHNGRAADARLIALAPEIARLLADTMDAAEKVAEHHFDTCDLELGLSATYPCSCGIDALRLALARFAVLTGQPE